MRQVEFFRELVERTGAINRIQVLTLEIFNNGNFELRFVIVSFVSDEGRDLRNPRKTCGTQTPFTSNKLVGNDDAPVLPLVFFARYDKRLKHAVLFDRLRKTLKRCLIKFFSRLIWVWGDFLHVNPEN